MILMKLKMKLKMKTIGVDDNKHGDDATTQFLVNLSGKGCNCFIHQFFSSGVLSFPSWEGLGLEGVRDGATPWLTSRSSVRRPRKLWRPALLLGAKHRGCVAVKCMDYSVSFGELIYSLSTCIVGTRIHRNPTTR